MRRLTQALERANGTLNESPPDVLRGLPSGIRVDALGEIGAVAEPSQESIRLPAVTQTKASKDEPAATRMTALNRCPQCERVQRAPAQAPGLCERILSLMRIRLHRCDFCGRRFRRVDAEDGDPVTDRHTVKMSSTFLPAADTRDFNELIRDLAHAEREQQRGQSLDSQQVRRKPHTRELRESSTPAAVGRATEDRSARLSRSDWSEQ
jgi:hypothetical protein